MEAMMRKTYFGFGIADNMFPEGVINIRRNSLTTDEACEIIASEEGLVACLNPSHALTINVMRERFGINVPIPERAPIVALVKGDRGPPSPRGTARVHGRGNRERQVPVRPVHGRSLVPLQHPSPSPRANERLAL